MNRQHQNIETELKSELESICSRYFNKIKEPGAFIVWFLKAFVTDSEEDALNALIDGPGDKGVDAIHVDDDACLVTLVQGKYRQPIGKGNETRSDLIAFAKVSEVFYDSEALKNIRDGMDSLAADRLERAAKKISQKNYRLRMYYVTSGRCSTPLKKEAVSNARISGKGNVFEVFDGKRIIDLMHDYLDGVAPPVPSLELMVENGHHVKLSGILNRYDEENDIESWILPVAVQEIARMYKEGGIRIFARNIRGFLGETAINRNMEVTLKNEPEFFWYYN